MQKCNFKISEKKIQYARSAPVEWLVSDRKTAKSMEPITLIISADGAARLPSGIVMAILTTVIHATGFIQLLSVTRQIVWILIVHQVLNHIRVLAQNLHWVVAYAGAGISKNRSLKSQNKRSKIEDYTVSDI